MQNLIDRFIKYAKIHTTSDEESLTVPSTEIQKNLGKILVKDLNKAIEYLTIGNNMNNIESSILLLYIYIEKYLKNKNNDILNKIKELVNIIENHPRYNNKIKK